MGGYICVETKCFDAIGLFWYLINELFFNLVYLIDMTGHETHSFCYFIKVSCDTLVGDPTGECFFKIIIAGKCP